MSYDHPVELESEQEVAVVKRTDNVTLTPDFSSEIEQLTEVKVEDTFYLAYISIIVQSAAIFMAWNFINFLSPTYYFDYWFSEMHFPNKYATKFMNDLGMAACSPLFAFTFICLIPVLKSPLIRMSISLILNITNLFILLSLAWVRPPEADKMQYFYNLTFTVLLIMMACTGVFQSSILSLTSDLPPFYTNAVVIGLNVGGLLNSLIYIFTTAANPKTPQPTAEAYYGFTSFWLIMCMNIVVFLWRSDFVRYYVKIGHFHRSQSKMSVSLFFAQIGHVFKDAWTEVLNIFILFFMMYTIYPTLSIGIQPWPTPGIAHLDKYYLSIGTFLNFYFFGLIGAIAANFVKIDPSNRKMRLMLCIPCFLSLILIPYFMFCNFIPNYPDKRTATVIFKNEWFYFIGNGFMGGLIGLLAGILLPLLPRCVEPAVSRIASQIGVAAMMTGLYFGAGMTAAFISALE